MDEKITYQQKKLSRGMLSLIAILLAFILMIVFIWLWYDIRITSIENHEQPKEQPLNQ